MLKIRHIALASDHPGKAAEFYKTAFGFREIKRFGLDPNKPDEAPPVSTTTTISRSLLAWIPGTSKPSCDSITHAS